MAYSTSTAYCEVIDILTKKDIDYREVLIEVAKRDPEFFLSVYNRFTIPENIVELVKALRSNLDSDAATYLRKELVKNNTDYTISKFSEDLILKHVKAFLIDRGLIKFDPWKDDRKKKEVLEVHPDELTTLELKIVSDIKVAINLLFPNRDWNKG
jgi:hypothetical protein